MGYFEGLCADLRDGPSSLWRVAAAGSDPNFSAGLGLNPGFTILGSQTNGALWEIVSHAYLIAN
jgi:hypothetical protein